MTADKCLVCFEYISNEDKLICNHYIHQKCIVEWIETINNTNKQLNKKLLHFGICPLCKLEQPHIKINTHDWYGTIILNNQMIQYFKEQNSFITSNLIPANLLIQLKDACIDEQIEIVNTAFSLIKLNIHEIKSMSLTKYPNGKFVSRMIY
jgi:hypothetical protein